MSNSNSAGRLGAALPLAAGVTFSLFFAMQLLVADKGVIPLQERITTTVDFSPVKPPEPPVKKVVERPDEVKAPEVPILDTPTRTSDGPGEVYFTPGPIAGPGDPVIGAGSWGVSPIVQVTPVYPRRGLIEGVEGFVILEFTVLPDGTVTDIRVVDEQPKGYGFGKAAMLAAAKFKYNARVTNGQKVATPGVRERFTFELQD